MVSSKHIAIWLPELNELIQHSQALQRYVPSLFKATAYGQLPMAQLDWLPVLGQNASLAAYARQYDNADAGQRYWLRADPVVMHADISRVHLLAIENHGLSVEQADCLLSSLQGLFDDGGLHLSRGQGYQAHERWYVCSDQPLPRGFGAPDAALGNPLEDFLRGESQSPDRHIWQRLQSEAQMQLHQHPVNHERQQQGLPALNSLWFWGAGRLPDQAAASVPDTVLAMSAELAGWCSWADVTFTHQPSGEMIQQWIAQAVSAADKIIIEWRIQRHLSLEKNLNQLDVIMADLLQQQASIYLYHNADCVDQLGKPKAWQRWLNSDKKMMARGTAKILQLCQNS